MNRKVFKLAIILCWATLAFCLIVKQFFPDMFLIVIENERFVAACDFIDGHIVIKEAVYALCSVISVGRYCGRSGLLRSVYSKGLQRYKTAVTGLSAA